MIGALQAALDAHATTPALRGVLLDAEGPHFSFGASVEEHLADRCAGMLASLHALILAMVGFPVPVLVAVRGQCLGGGLEIALAGGPIFAAPNAQFGQPEIKLGVFAPAASVPAALARERQSPPRTCCLGPQHRRRAALASAWCTRWPTTPRPRRWPTSTSTWRRAAPPRWRMRCRRARGARVARCANDLARVERLYLRPPDVDPRRQRGAGRLPRQARTALGAPLMSTTLPEVTRIVQRCEALFEDLHFEAVKAWKAAVPGRKAIGYMPVYVPRELIHAAGMLPVGILGGGDQIEVIQGDAYYQSYICRIPRSTIELGLTGRLDCLDGMLFPASAT
jgi:hypothetical protein